MSFLRPNLDLKGRLLRGLLAAVLTASAVLCWSHSRIAFAVLAISAAFVAFEAVRGWCALRACGVKTKF